jgi:hypothetical protein
VRRAHLALALLLACGEDAPEAPAETPAEAPAPAAAAADATPKVPAPAAGPPPASGWSAATVDGLTPVVPSRAGKTPAPLASSPAIDTTLQRLERVVKKHGGDPTNPWAIGHALIGMGPDFQLSNGQPAVDWLFSEYAVELTAEGVTTVQFPRKKGDIRVEPHKQLMLKAMTESGVSPDRAVTVQGKPHTVADLYRGAVLASWLVPARNHSSFSSPNDMPWAVQALSTWAPPGDFGWTAIDGTPMVLDDLATFTTSVLVAESQPLFQAMEAGAALQKRKQGVFAYTCGGAHLLQGTAYAVARGRSTDLAYKAIQGQIPLLYWRLPQELKVYDDATSRAPQHARVLLVQRLKFLGHWLETAHKLAILGFYAPTAEQQRSLDGAAQQLALTVEALEQQGMFGAMDQIRAEDEQLYLDLIGDSAHALHALRIARGEHTIAW